MRFLTFECGLNCSKEGLSADGLAQKVDRSRLQCSLARGLIRVRGDEDERSVTAFRHEPTAQLDAGHAAELDVEHEAVELRMVLVGEKRFCRGIRDRVNPGRAQEPAE